MRLLFAFAALLLAAPAFAQPAPSAPATADPAFTRRASQLLELVAGKIDYDGDYFSPSFKAAVPRARLAPILGELARLGPPTGIEGIDQETPWAGTVRVGFRDMIVSMQLRVDEAPPHHVNGLLVIADAVRTSGTPAQAATEIKALHGETGFAVARLGSGAPRLLDGHNADKPFAIGSAFKLVILAELVRATNAGERHWDDPVTLDGKPLPGGTYAQKPAGTQVTLRELATLMISISDNSATDILLKTLGREKVEAMMPVLGIADPARNRPFLTTLDMFKLKGIGRGALARRYLALDEAGRRTMLAGEVASQPLILIDPTNFQQDRPVMIDTLEWFESPNDLVRVMDWLRRNTEGPKGADARAILSKNPGVPLDKARFPWIGFKGGSEPGVLNLTLLLQSAQGDWYVVTASWNDGAAPVDTGKLVALVATLTGLAER